MTQGATLGVVAILAVPIVVEDAADARRALDGAQSAAEAGADLIEWRVDSVVGLPETASLLQTLIDGVPCASLLTCRSEQEGGSFEGDDDDLVEWIEQAATLDSPPLWIDVEWVPWLRSESLRRAAAAARAAGIKILLSFHDFNGRPADLLRLSSDMQQAEVDAVKLVWRARSLRDNVECCDLLQHRLKPMVAMCMGPHGLLSRVMAGAWGGLLTFAAADPGAATAPGQPTVHSMLHQWRFRSISPTTAIYGLIGDPLGHSPGYRKHNEAFEQSGFDGVYVPLPIAAGWESLKATLATLIDHPSFPLRGASVTLPHKEDLIRFATEFGGEVTSRSQASGAANTITLAVDGKMHVENTDFDGILAPLKALGATLAGGRVAILGAGGVARAAAGAACEAGATVHVFNGSRDRAAALVDDLGRLGPVSLGEADGPFDGVVQATSVGMSHGPAPDANPIHTLGLQSEHIFGPTTVCLETIYTPLDTPFVVSARAAGCAVATGMDMWNAQATAQQVLWTGHAPDPPFSEM